MEMNKEEGLTFKPNNHQEDNEEKTVMMSLEEKQKYIQNLNYLFCDEVSKYEKIAKIGHGTFGEVFKARHRETNEMVALKKVLTENENDGFPITAIREIKILQILKNTNIVNLIEVCRTKPDPHNKFTSTFFMVFELCAHDLAGLLSNPNVKFSLGEIKMVISQLLNGLFFIHANKILHRDIKSANVLLTKEGVLKLADFGLARPFSVPGKNGEPYKPNRYTNRVVTLWYRPPELLLGERNYGPTIDMWGAGCVMAEMWTRSPIMQGYTEQKQIYLISQFCGPITPEVWPGVEELPIYKQLNLPKHQMRSHTGKDTLNALVKCPLAIDLLDKLLTLDPSKRIDTDRALNHDFLWTNPMPVPLDEMLKKHKDSMLEFFVPKLRQQMMGRSSSNPNPQPNSNPQLKSTQSRSSTSTNASGKSTQKNDEYRDQIF